MQLCIGYYSATVNCRKHSCMHHTNIKIITLDEAVNVRNENSIKIREISQITLTR